MLQQQLRITIHILWIKKLHATYFKWKTWPMATIRETTMGRFFILLHLVLAHGGWYIHFCARGWVHYLLKLSKSKLSLVKEETKHESISTWLAFKKFECHIGQKPSPEAVCTVEKVIIHLNSSHLIWHACSMFLADPLSSGRAVGSNVAWACGGVCAWVAVAGVVVVTMHVMISTLFLFLPPWYKQFCSNEICFLFLVLQLTGLRRRKSHANEKRHNDIWIML